MMRSIRAEGRMTVGLLLPHFGPYADTETILQAATRAETAGFDAVWVRDHLLWTPHAHESPDATFVEPLMTLAAVAARTTSIALGTAVLIPLRWPLKLAQDLAALAHLAGDRVIAGIGTGHKHAELMGTGFDPEKRLQIALESVAISRLIWSQDHASYAGEVFQFQDISISPKPTQPIPWLYGGSTRAAVRIAHGHCDGWLPGGMPLPTLDARLDYLMELEGQVARDLTLAYLPRTRIARTRAEAYAGIDIAAFSTGSEGSRHWLPASFDTVADLRGIVVAGEPMDIAEQVRAIHERGFHHFVFDLRDQFDRLDATIDLIAERVLPELSDLPLIRRQ